MMLNPELTAQLKHRSRVKKRYMSGDTEAFSKRDLIELLLFYTFRRTDTKTAARKLLSRFGSLTELFAADEKDIEKVDSIGSETARFISVMACIMDRYKENLKDDGKCIAVPGDAAEIFADIFSCSACDCAAVLVDGTGNIINVLSLDTPREIMKDGSFSQIVNACTSSGARGFFLGERRLHGLMKPMKEDIEFAYLMKTYADAAEIEYCNHIITGKNSSCIFSQTGCFPPGMFTYT